MSMHAPAYTGATQSRQQHDIRPRYAPYVARLPHREWPGPREVDTVIDPHGKPSLSMLSE